MNDVQTALRDVEMPLYDLYTSLYDYVFIIPSESIIMIKVQDTIAFAYDIVVCMHNIIATTSQTMLIAQDTTKC